MFFYPLKLETMGIEVTFSFAWNMCFTIENCCFFPVNKFAWNPLPFWCLILAYTFNTIQFMPFWVQFVDSYMYSLNKCSKHVPPHRIKHVPDLLAFFYSLFSDVNLQYSFRCRIPQNNMDQQSNFSETTCKIQIQSFSHSKRCTFWLNGSLAWFKLFWYSSCVFASVHECQIAIEIKRKRVKEIKRKRASITNANHFVDVKFFNSMSVFTTHRNAKMLIPIMRRFWSMHTFEMS